jgi:uncharacterized protein (TIGR02996 family)
VNDKAFLDDVCAHPDDDAIRLIYADWLDDNGDPEHAEFLRAGVALARLAEADPLYPETLARARRAGVLTRAGRKPWVDHVPGARVQFRRGLIAGVALSPLRYEAQTPEDWRFVPAEQLHLRLDPATSEDRYPDPARLAARPELARVRTLVLGCWTPGDALRALLTDCPALAGLRALAVDGPELWKDREAFAPLGPRLALPALDSLRFGDLRGLDGLGGFLEGCRRPLRRLRLTYDGGERDWDDYHYPGWPEVVRSRHWPHLREGTIYHIDNAYHTEVEPAPVRDLSAVVSGGIQRLTLTASDAAGLARLEDWGPLRELYIGLTEDSENLGGLIDSPAVARLESIGIERGSLEPALLASPRLAGLRRFGPSLSAGPDDYRRASFLPGLLRLSPATTQQAVGLPLPQLRHLELYDVTAGEQLAPLLASGLLPNLCTLVLHGFRGRLTLPPTTGSPHLSLVGGDPRSRRWWVVKDGAAVPVAEGVDPTDDDWWELGPFFPWW